MERIRDSPGDHPARQSEECDRDQQQAELEAAAGWAGVGHAVILADRDDERFRAAR
jgi:hypothetical protein